MAERTRAPGNHQPKLRCMVNTLVTPLPSKGEGKKNGQRVARFRCSHQSPPFDGGESERVNNSAAAETVDRRLDDAMGTASPGPAAGHLGFMAASQHGGTGRTLAMQHTP